MVWFQQLQIQDESVLSYFDAKGEKKKKDRNRVQSSIPNLEITYMLQIKGGSALLIHKML